MLALTFDDGPDPRGTPAVLAALAEVGVTATFFVLGERVVEHPGLLEDVRAAGHDVQVHGFAHLRHPECTRAEIAADLRQALDVIGGEPTLWRVPWGHLAEFTPELAREHGLTLAGWTLDSHDWRGDAAGEMLAALVPGLEPRAIVLAHDGVGSGARRATAQETAKLVGPLVAAARDTGLEPGPLDWSGPLPPANPELHAWVVPGA